MIFNNVQNITKCAQYNSSTRIDNVRLSGKRFTFFCLRDG